METMAGTVGSYYGDVDGSSCDKSDVLSDRKLQCKSGV